MAVPMLHGLTFPNTLFPRGITYNLSIIFTSWKTCKPGAFGLNIIELSADVRKQAYG